jgi:RNA polymerase sigma-70 factor (ECF subfamily)
MNETDWLAQRFEDHRPHLQAVAYRMLGSLAEADDAVQETWVRLSRTDISDVDNLGGWLTTVVSRVCLNMLRSHTTRREAPLDDAHVPDPITSIEGNTDPEQEALLADSVGLALLVVLETLPPAERMAFVLHDMFGVSFDDIATIVDRSPAAARQLASRARRRVRGAAPTPDQDFSRQRCVVDAFFAAARGGDFEALISVLDPDVVLRADFGPAAASAVVRGAAAVAGRAVMFADPSRELTPAVVNGTPGVVVTVAGRVVSVMAFTVVAGRVAAIDTLGDPERLANLHIAGLEISGTAIESRSSAERGRSDP